MKAEELLSNHLSDSDVRWRGHKSNVVEAMEAYANQRVIEELEEWVDYLDNQYHVWEVKLLASEVKNRIKELKQNQDG